MKFIKIVLALVFLAFLAVAGLSFWVFRSVNAAVTHSKSNDYINIEKGTPPREIITKLAADGIIASETATNIYLRTLGDSSKLQTGEYQFASPIPNIQGLKHI